MTWAWLLFWRIVRITTGCVLLLSGVALGPVPILPGWPLVAIGVLLLAADVPLFARLIRRCEDRFPTLKGVLSRLHPKHKTTEGDAISSQKGQSTKP
jgi:hypothetical protein